jgi:glutamine synthetase
LAVQLAAGLDGIRNEIDPPEPVDKNIFELTVRERRKYKIKSLPRDLGEAVEEFRKSAFMRETLGEHVFEHFLAAKEQEWHEYTAQVHDWEIERYLSAY